MATKPLRSVSLIFSPYHAGVRGVGVAQGPSYIRDRGLTQTLEQLGLAVREREIEPVDGFEGDIGRSFEVIRRIARLVTEECDAESFPIVLSGNCNASVGVAAGLCGSRRFAGSAQLGCVWFDAHDDFNIPDTVISGYFDSMAVAMLTGLCWKGLLETVPGHRPLAADHITFVGLRDVTDLERSRVVEAGFDVVWGSVENKVDYQGELGGILDKKKQDKKKLEDTMIHLDLDCLDISLGKVNQFAAPGGLLEDDLHACLKTISARTRPASLTVASFDPTLGGGQRIADITVQAIKTFIGSLVASGTLSVES